MRLFVVQRIIGAVIALSGVIMLPPIALSLAFDDGTTVAFVESALLSLLVGGLLWLPVRRARGELRALRENVPISRMTERGEPVMLDAGAREAEGKRLEAFIEESCGSSG